MHVQDYMNKRQLHLLKQCNIAEVSVTLATDIVKDATHIKCYNSARDLPKQGYDTTS